jgi:hypothetical protein
VNRFVEQCRREWKRLRVSDPIADEMAAELEADLEEAEAEGASAEEVLRSGASDSRSFASSWAAERGVVPPAKGKLLGRPLLLAAIVALAVVAVVGAGLAIFASPRGSSVQVMPLAKPTASIAVRARLGHAVPANGSGADLHTAGSILLIVGGAGLVLSMLLLVWSSRAGRDRRSPAGPGSY